MKAGIDGKRLPASIIILLLIITTYQLTPPISSDQAFEQWYLVSKEDVSMALLAWQAINTYPETRALKF